MLVARGSSAGPAFQTVDLPALSEAPAVILSLQPFAHGLLIGTNSPAAFEQVPTSTPIATDAEKAGAKLVRGQVTVVVPSGTAQPSLVRGLVSAADGAVAVDGKASGRKRQGADLDAAAMPVALEAEGEEAGGMSMGMGIVIGMALI